MMSCHNDPKKLQQVQSCLRNEIEGYYDKLPIRFHPEPYFGIDDIVEQILFLYIRNRNVNNPCEDDLTAYQHSFEISEWRVMVRMEPDEEDVLRKEIERGRKYIKTIKDSNKEYCSFHGIPHPYDYSEDKYKNDYSESVLKNNESRTTMTEEMAVFATLFTDIPILKDIYKGRISKSKKVSNGRIREEFLRYYGLIALLLEEIDNADPTSIIMPAVVRFELESAFHIEWVNQLADYMINNNKPLPNGNRVNLFCRPLAKDVSYGFEFDEIASDWTIDSLCEYLSNHEGEYFDIENSDLFSDLRIIPFEYSYPLPGSNSPQLLRNHLVDYVFEALDSEWNELQGKYLFAHDLIAYISYKLKNN